MTQNERIGIMHPELLEKEGLYELTTSVANLVIDEARRIGTVHENAGKTWATISFSSEIAFEDSLNDGNKLHFVPHTITIGPAEGQITLSISISGFFEGTPAIYTIKRYGKQNPLLIRGVGFSPPVPDDGHMTLSITPGIIAMTCTQYVLREARNSTAHSTTNSERTLLTN